MRYRRNYNVFRNLELPTLEQAIAYIEEAKILNLCPWVEYSFKVATAAKTSAS